MRIWLALPTYQKPHLATVDLLAHLDARGLGIADRQEAARFTEEVGFDRLRIYFHSRRDSSVPGRPFHPGTTFDEIIQIYNFDQELRSIVFGYVAKLEIIFKTSVSEVVCSAFGSHPYFNSDVYNSNKCKIECISSLSAINKKYFSKDRRIIHYFDKYTDPAFPPLWTMREFMTFGSMNFFYQRIESSLRNSAARQMGLPSDVLLSKWIDCIVDLRNACAHHDRVFNRVFQKTPTKLRSKNIPNCQDASKVAALCQMIDYILNHRGAQGSSVNEVQNLIANQNVVTPAELGF